MHQHLYCTPVLYFYVCTINTNLLCCIVMILFFCTLVNRHRTECQRRGSGTKAQDMMWVKDLLTEHVKSFPQENVDHHIYGQKGCEDDTFEEMFELYQQHTALKANPSQFSKLGQKIQKVSLCEQMGQHSTL